MSIRPFFRLIGIDLRSGVNRDAALIRAYSQKVADFLDKNMRQNKELERAIRFHRIGERTRPRAKGNGPLWT